MKKILIIITFAIMGFTVIMMFFRINKYRDLSAYIEKLSEIEWNGCLEPVEGNIAGQAVK